MALERPGIFLWGPRRVGKTSLLRVVFAKLPPHETLFLAPTPRGAVRVCVCATNPYCQVALWDFPGDFEWSRAVVAGLGGPGSLTQGSALTGSLIAGTSLVAGGSLIAGGSLLSASMPPGMHTLTHAHAGGSLGSSSTALGASLGARVNCIVFEDPQDDVDGVDDESDGGGAPSVCVRTSVTERDALEAAAGVVFVINSSEEQLSPDALESLRQLCGALHAIARVRGAAPSVDVFLHAADDGARADNVRELASQVVAEVADMGFAVRGAGVSARPAGGSAGAVPITLGFHSTSVFDHSVFEAMSKVVQKVTPGPTLMPAVENLLNSLNVACGAEKVFLFDVVNKLYFATDSSPASPHVYELAADSIDVAVDVACIYDPVNTSEHAGMDADDTGGIGRALAAASGASSAADAGRCSVSVVKLANGVTLYMREVAPYLAAIVVFKEAAAADDEDAALRTDDAMSAAHEPLSESLPSARGHESTSDGSDVRGTKALPRAALSMPNRALIDYNISVFARALAGVFAVKFAAQSSSAMSAGAAASLAASYKGASMMGVASAFTSIPSSAGLPLSSSLTSAGALYSRSYGGRGPAAPQHAPGDAGIELGTSPRKADGIAPAARTAGRVH